MPKVSVASVLAFALLVAVPAGPAAAQGDQLESPAVPDSPQPADDTLEPDAPPDGGQAGGQEAEKDFPELKYYEAPALFICPVHVPEDYDPDQSYPLVIGLHGFAGSPEMFHSLYYAFDDPQYIYAAPQAPYPLPMGSYLGFSWVLNDLEGNPIVDSLHLSEQYVLNVIEQLRADYRVSDVYLLGFSQGCALAYLTGMRHPELVTGIICFDGWFDADWFGQNEDLSAATGLRVMIAHATDDPAVAFERGVDSKEQLEKLGYDVEFLRFEGGHTLTAEALKKVEDWVENPPGP